MKMTRRQLAAAALAVTAAKSQTPAASPDEELKAARDRLKATSDTLAKQTVPMSIEPAFQFKAL